MKLVTDSTQGSNSIDSPVDLADLALISSPLTTSYGWQGWRTWRPKKSLKCHYDQLNQRWLSIEVDTTQPDTGIGYKWQRQSSVFTPLTTRRHKWPIPHLTNLRFCIRLTTMKVLNKLHSQQRPHARPISTLYGTLQAKDHEPLDSTQRWFRTELRKWKQVESAAPPAGTTNRDIASSSTILILQIFTNHIFWPSGISSVVEQTDMMTSID